MTTRNICPVCPTLISLLLLAGAASAQVEITRSVFSAAGGAGNGSGGLVLAFTVGQSAAGSSSSASVVLDAGFWLPSAPAVPPCPAEFNGDGTLNADDLGDYITCFFSAPPCDQAEFNHDGDVNADDLGDYITAFFAGC